MLNVEPTRINWVWDSGLRIIIIIIIIKETFKPGTASAILETMTMVEPKKFQIWICDQAWDSREIHIITHKTSANEDFKDSSDTDLQRGVKYALGKYEINSYCHLGHHCLIALLQQLIPPL